MRICLVTIICLVAFTAWAVAEYEFPADYKSATGELKKIIVDCPQGVIRFEQSLNDEISIRVLRVIHLENQEKAERIAKQIKVDFRKDGESLFATIDAPSRNSHVNDIIGNLFSGNFQEPIEILVKVTAPINLALKVTTASADIIANDLRNNLTVKGASADIRLENITGECDFHLTSGDLTASYIEGNISFWGSSSDIEIDAFKGNLSAITSSGDGTVRNAKGAIKIETTSGDLRAYDIYGDLDLVTTSGDIFCENLNGSVNATSISGDVRLTGLVKSQGDFSATTISGDVQLEVARDFNGRLNIETGSGEINAHMDLDFYKSSDSYLEGKTGEGGGIIKIITTSGDVSLSEM